MASTPYLPLPLQDERNAGESGTADEEYGHGKIDAAAEPNTGVRRKREDGVAGERDVREKKDGAAARPGRSVEEEAEGEGEEGDALAEGDRGVIASPSSAAGDGVDKFEAKANGGANDHGRGSCLPSIKASAPPAQPHTATTGGAQNHGVATICFPPPSLAAPNALAGAGAAGAEAGAGGGGVYSGNFYLDDVADRQKQRDLMSKTLVKLGVHDFTALQHLLFEQHKLFKQQVSLMHHLISQHMLLEKEMEARRQRSTDAAGADASTSPRVNDAYGDAVQMGHKTTSVRGLNSHKGEGFSAPSPFRRPEQGNHTATATVHQNHQHQLQQQQQQHVLQRQHLGMDPMSMWYDRHYGASCEAVGMPWWSDLMKVFGPGAGFQPPHLMRQQPEQRQAKAAAVDRNADALRVPTWSPSAATTDAGDGKANGDGRKRVKVTSL